MALYADWRELRVVRQLSQQVVAKAVGRLLALVPIEETRRNETVETRSELLIGQVNHVREQVVTDLLPDGGDGLDEAEIDAGRREPGKQRVEQRRRDRCPAPCQLGCGSAGRLPLDLEQLLEKRGTPSLRRTSFST